MTSLFFNIPKVFTHASAQMFIPELLSNFANDQIQRDALFVWHHLLHYDINHKVLHNSVKHLFHKVPRTREWMTMNINYCIALSDEKSIMCNGSILHEWYCTMKKTKQSYCISLFTWYRYDCLIIWLNITTIVSRRPIFWISCRINF